MSNISSWTHMTSRPVWEQVEDYFNVEIVLLEQIQFLHVLWCAIIINISTFGLILNQKEKKIMGLSWLDQPQTYFYLDNKTFYYIVYPRKKAIDKGILWSTDIKCIIEIWGNQKYLFCDKIKWGLFHFLSNFAFDK